MTVTWRDRAIDAEKQAAAIGQVTLHVHALMARARTQGRDTVPLDELRQAVGELPAPNSVTEWARQGALDALIDNLAHANGKEITP